MCKLLTHWIILFLLFVIFSCSKQKEIKEKIFQAENLIQQQPDSAFQLLNTVLFPEDLNKTLFNKYTLLMLQAKDKTEKDITSDTLIFAVKDYYVQKKDYPNAAVAAFYCGRVRHEQKNEKAAEAYHEAEKWAEKTDNYNLKGLILGNLGILHREHSSYEKAIEFIKNAAEMYDKAKNYRNKISALRIIGDCLLLNKKIDESFYYYDEGLALAESNQMIDLQISIKNSMALAYRQKEDYEQAKKLFNEVLAFPDDSVEQARVLLNIAQIYMLEENMDSVNFYLDKASALQTENPWLMRSTYSLKSKIAEKKNRYREALGHYKEYYRFTTKVVDSEKNNKLREIQEKYDFEKIRISKKESDLKHQQALSVFSFVVLAAVIIVFVYYRKHARNKRIILETEQKLINLQKISRELSENKKSLQKITQELSESKKSLQKITQELSESKESLRNTLFHQLNILTKTSLIESEINEDERKSGQKLLKKFNKILYGQGTLDWDKLYQIMNTIQNGYYEEIREKYPKWSETEFRIFCLTYAKQFNDTEIALILNKTLPMIRKIRNKIRKDMGTPKYSHDFTIVS